MLNEGNIIFLDCEYVILKTIYYQNMEYLYLISNSKPIKMMLCKRTNELDELETVTNKQEIINVLNELKYNN